MWHLEGWVVVGNQDVAPGGLGGSREPGCGTWRVGC